MHREGDSEVIKHSSAKTRLCRDKLGREASRGIKRNAKRLPNPPKPSVS